MQEFDAGAARVAVMHTLYRSIHSYSSTSSFSEMAMVPNAELAALFQNRHQRTHDLLSSYDIRISPTEGFAERLLLHSASDAQNAVAAACLVFSHSMADGAVTEFCMVAADYDRKFWSKLVEAHTFTIKQVINQGRPDDLVRSAVRRKIKGMSLPAKMKHLLKNAGTHAKVEYDFVYDKGRLQELDGIRHDIIHGERIGTKIGARDSQEFFFMVTVYAALVTASMLGLSIRYPQLIVEWAEDLAESVKAAQTNNGNVVV